MKAKTLLLLAGFGSPLILSGSAPGGFTGFEILSKPNEYGITAFNLYALFDDPANDHLLAVGGTPQSPAHIAERPPWSASRVRV